MSENFILTQKKIFSLNGIQDVVDNGKLFCTTKRRNSAVMYVNTYLSGTTYFKFNNVDGIKVKDINAKLVGELFIRYH